ncbi:hypothetical protein HZS_3500, partial [Henneguya salminicola]
MARGCKVQKESLIVDCANGVGANKLRELINCVYDLNYITIKNDGSDGELNYLCGADYVKIYQKSPENFEYTALDKCASFDGDADRIICFYKNELGSEIILDGDYISILYMYYIKKILSTFQHNLRCGFIHANYSNSATSTFAKANGFKTVCSKTGVKYLHAEAVKFDIGIYFEANGHGTALFGSCTKEFLAAIKSEDSYHIFFIFRNYKSAKKLLALSDVINKSPKKDILITSYDEQTVISPENVQNEINEVVKAYPGSRAFV